MFRYRPVGHLQASHTFLAQKIADKVKEQPSYHPVNIIRNVQRDKGSKLHILLPTELKNAPTKSTMEHTMQLIKPSPNIAKISSTATQKALQFSKKTLDNKFLRLFICYGACASGVKKNKKWLTLKLEEGDYFSSM